MHLIICNERLLFRFGVDRVLLLLARRLAAAGWKISFVAQNADIGVLRQISEDIHILPQDSGPYLERNDSTAEWLRQHAANLIHRAPGERVLALIGGWPFYACIPVFRALGVGVAALDCGAVPTDGMAGAALQVQQRLRQLRREYLPEAHRHVPISDFIARTQTRVDAGPRANITTIHLGADHLQGNSTLWEEGHATAQSLWPVQEKNTGKGKRILNLGRWELGNYKNSEALYRLARGILPHFPDAVFGVLAQPAELSIPPDLTAAILPLGHVSDAALADLMRSADLGLSVSLWEGFNLPLAEMQQTGKPVLVFTIGAHPEVVAHPQQLCADENEMLTKALAVLAGTWLPDAAWAAAVAEVGQRLTWENTSRAWETLLAACLPTREPAWPQIVLDASACLRDPANTGVARVVRSLARKLQSFGQPVFVAWDETLACYVLPTEDEYQNLGRYGGPDPLPAHYTLRRSHPLHRTRLGSAYGNRLRGGWLLQGEIIFETHGPERRSAARDLGLRVAAIFYDAIPVTHPHWVKDEKIRHNHADYMRGLAECDRVLPISGDAGRQLADFWERCGISPRAVLTSCWIPGELSASARASQAPSPPQAGERLRLLCVSTLEPRKNHAVLLAAVASLCARHPDLDWQLDLIGNRYAGGDAIWQSVLAAAESDPRIVWHGVVSDADLNAFYAQAHITIYPSLVEGYGMPIVESLWHARPCICHHQGVMAELAAAGGCVTVNMTDPDDLAACIHALATQPTRYRELAEAAVLRHIPTWRSYARDVLTQLATHTAPAPSLPQRWQQCLLPASLAIETAPERQLTQLAFACLLQHQNIRCCVVAGEIPAWLGQLLAACTQFTWQIAAAATATLPCPQGGLIRMEGALVDMFDVLIPELLAADTPPGLFVLAGEELTLLWPRLTALHSALVVIPDTDRPHAAALGLATPDIELAGYAGYVMPPRSLQAGATA